MVAQTDWGQRNGPGKETAGTTGNKIMKQSRSRRLISRQGVQRRSTRPCRQEKQDMEASLMKTDERWGYVKEAKNCCWSREGKKPVTRAVKDWQKTGTRWSTTLRSSILPLQQTPSTLPEVFTSSQHQLTRTTAAPGSYSYSTSPMAELDTPVTTGPLWVTKRLQSTEVLGGLIAFPKTSAPKTMPFCNLACTARVLLSCAALH